MSNFEFAPFSFDSSRGELQRPNGPVVLRPMTNKLLVFFLENRHRIISKDEIIETVWSGKAVVENVLQQSIKEIRTFLDDDPKNPKYIRNFPRRGYQWVFPATYLVSNESIVMRPGISTAPSALNVEGANQMEQVTFNRFPSRISLWKQQMLGTKHITVRVTALVGLVFSLVFYFVGFFPDNTRTPNTHVYV